MKKGKKGVWITAAAVGLVLVSAALSGTSPIQANEDKATEETKSSEAIISPLNKVEENQLETSAELPGFQTELSQPIAKMSIAPLATAADWGTEAAATNVIEVSTWDQLYKAIMNTYTGAEAYKNNADYIKVTANIENPGDLGTGDIPRRAPDDRVNYVIDGQGHTVDFNQVRFTWRSNDSDERHIYVKNIKMYGQSAYGPFAIGDNTKITSTITYEDVYYRGSQLTASYKTTMRFKGTNEFYSVNSYEAPLRPGVNKNTWTNQSGLEAFRAIYEKDSNTTVNVQNGNGFILASFLGNSGSTSGQPAYARLENNAVLDITTNGNSGEAFDVGNYVMALRKGDMFVENGAKIYARTADSTTRGGIQLYSNTTFSIAKDAEVNVEIKGPMSGTTAINLGSDSKFNVSTEGKMNINLNNQGSSTRDVVDAGSRSEFVVGKKATFNIKLADGTGTRNLFNIGSNGIFRFADAYSIDLDARGNTNAHLVYMSNPGHFIADVQKVSTWLKSPVSADPYKIWNPIYGVDVTYNGRNTTNIAGQSVTAPVSADFLANYRTTTSSNNPHSGFSRVLYEYIPDVILGLDQPTDNPTETSNKVLSGIVNPDPDYMNGTGITFYRVVDEDDPSKDILLTEPQTPSPIPGDARKFHVIADPLTGKFQYTLPSDVILKAGEKIKAVGWLNGKENYDIKTVLDTTPPEGDPRTVHSAVGETAPQPGEFVQNPTDTNPVTPTFGYEFAEENSLAQIAAMMATQGEYPVFVYVLDNAVDASGASKPNKTKIESKLVVHETLDFIEADPVNLKTSDISSLSESQLKALLIQKSNAEASTIIDGNLSDLTNKIQVTDLDGLTPSTTGGIFNVELSVKQADSGLDHDIKTKIQVFIYDDTWIVGKYGLRGINFTVASKDYPTSEADIKSMIRTQGELQLKQLLPPPAIDMNATDIEIDTSNLPAPRTTGVVTPAGTYNVPIAYGTGTDRVTKTIVVTITQSEATLRVRFVDENDNDIVSHLDIDVMSGQLYDLTGNGQVTAKITEATGLHYDLFKRPVKEDEYEITSDPMIAKYEFTGKLDFVSIPSVLNFGLKNVEGQKIRENAPTYTEALKIADTRPGINKSWTLKATLSEPLKSEDGTVVIPDAIRYKKPAATEFILNDAAQVMVSNNNSTEKTYDISSTWGTTAESSGFKLEIPSVKVKQLAKYSAEITYTLSDAYEP